MVELSAKVSRTLNKTTPGIQIWRIEVGMGAHHWAVLGGGVGGGGWVRVKVRVGLCEGRSSLCLLSSWVWGSQCSIQGKTQQVSVLGSVGCMGLGWGFPHKG